MKKTLEEIENEIRALENEKGLLNAVTVDGFPVGIGMTVYEVSDVGVEETTLSDKTEFRVYDLYDKESGGGYYNYSDIYADKETAIADYRQQIEDDLKNLKARVRQQKFRLERFNAMIALDISSV